MLDFPHALHHPPRFSQRHCAGYRRRLDAGGAARAAAAQYPPALTGMRGQHPGSFEVAHAFAREGQRFGVDSAAAEESYDLVVVGGGISGLAAAWFYRRAVGRRPAFSFSTITTISAAMPSATNSRSAAHADRLRRQPIDPVAEDIVERRRQGSAARSRRRYRAVRDRV